MVMGVPAVCCAYPNKLKTTISPTAAATLSRQHLLCFCMFRCPASRLELASSTQRSVHLLCFLQAAVAFIPIDVLHECVDIHARIRAEIHVIGMFKHVVHQDRTTKRQIVRVIERNVVVEFAVAEVEVQNGPAASSAQRVRCRTESLFPLVESAEVRRDCLLHA